MNSRVMAPVGQSWFSAPVSKTKSLFKNGWLDAPTYGPAARKAWIAVTGFIDQNGDVTSICQGIKEVEKLLLLPAAQAQNRRFPRAGAGVVGCVRTVAVGLH